MVNRTVGVDGYHPSWKEAYDALVAASPLSDSYTFRQISDCTINNNWPNAQIDLGGHSVKFYCPFADSHQGDPTKGFVTYLTGAFGRMHITVDNTTLADTITVDGLRFVETALTGNTLLFIRTWNTSDEMTINAKNLLIKGYSDSVGVGVRFGNNLVHINASNMKIWNIENPFSGIFPSYSAVDMTDKHIAENITVIISANGSFGFRFHSVPGVPLGNEWTMRNCVAYGGDGVAVLDWHVIPGTARIKAENCAGSDGSLTDAASTGIEDTNAKDNIVPADEFASLNQLDSDFLDLIEGSASLNASSSHDKGKAPLRVDFNANVLFQDYSPNLGRNGAAPSISDTDIKGNARPGVDDAYSIGAHEQQYSNFEGM